MGIKFGEIDSGQILDNEFRINVLERLIEFHAANNRYPNVTELRSIREDVVRVLQGKYPNSGVKLNS